jgi:FtsZ-binding cell division protein ZapB
LDTLEKLESKVGQILSKLKDLEGINNDLVKKNRALEAEAKALRLELGQVKEENIDLKSKDKERDVKVQDKISELLGKLEEVEAEIV